jgi:ATP-dependent DNA helicase RecG
LGEKIYKKQIEKLSNGVNKNYTGVHIQLSVYNDKIILWNPGKLPVEIAVDDLKRKHPSIPRNKYIADIFFKAGYIEAWGRGIQKIISGFIEAGHPQPTFEELAGGMQVTLYKSVEKSVEKIVLLIENNPKITQMKLAEATGLSRRGVEKNITKLKKEGRIIRIGPAKGGHWEVRKQK